jgi:hypothetical protein
VEFDCQRGMTGYHGFMKKFFAFLVALLSAWIIFTPFDLPPFPFLFVDEAIALVLLTKSLRYLGFDIAPWLRYLPKKKSPSRPSSGKTKKSQAKRDPIIDV